MTTVRLPDSLHVLERGWLSSNQVVFLDDARSASVVDTGYVKHRDMTVSLVRQALSGRQLTRILNTHLHADHCGGNALLQTTFACEIWVPPLSWGAASQWNLAELNFPAVGQRCERFYPTHRLDVDRDIVLGGLLWQVLAAPGHDPESIVLFSPETRILVSADALWADGFGVIFPELSGDSGFVEQASMLDLIARLDPQVVIPGHGPVFNDVRGALQRASRRLEGMRADPERHARHAMKVLVMFLLLELEQATEQQVQLRLGSGRIVQDTATVMGVSTSQGIAWAIRSLVDAGRIRRDGSDLHRV